MNLPALFPKQMRQAQRREQELEGTNAELSESIAAKQREVETLKASFQQMGDSSHSTDLEMHRSVASSG